jgi:hypothetical protein
MTSIPGVDYAWSHPGGAALKAAGKRFAARYLSHDADKNLTRTEGDDLAAHGVSCVAVWESTAQRPLAGRAAGVADAAAAAGQALAAGMPPDRPLYFAVDFDAQPSQMPAVLAYLDGAASVLGRDRVGVYGGYATVRAALDGGHSAWAWQTRAWSQGRWDARAAIRQGATQTIGGVSCDLNTATTADYGQWMPGRTPLTEDDMDAAQAKQLKELHDALVPYMGWQYKGKGKADAWGLLNQLVTQQAAQNAAVTAMAKALAATHGVDTAAVIAAVQQEIRDAVIHVEITTAPDADAPAAPPAAD